MKRELSRGIVFFCALLSLPAFAGAGAPKAAFRDPSFDFGRAMHGSVGEHDFVLRNEGSAALRIVKAGMTPPLLVTRMPRELAPGGEGMIHFKLDTTDLSGPFRGRITVFLNDPDLPEADLSFEGVVIPPVEVSPLPAFFVSGMRAKGASGSVEIINHEPEPLGIIKVEHASERFTTNLETLQPGQHYKLTLILKPNGPGGRKTESIGFVAGTSPREDASSAPSVDVFRHDLFR